MLCGSSAESDTGIGDSKHSWGMNVIETLWRTQAHLMKLCKLPSNKRHAPRRSMAMEELNFGRTVCVKDLKWTWRLSSHRTSFSRQVSHECPQSHRASARLHHATTRCLWQWRRDYYLIPWLFSSPWSMYTKPTLSASLLHRRINQIAMTHILFRKNRELAQIGQTTTVIKADHSEMQYS